MSPDTQAAMPADMTDGDAGKPSPKVEFEMPEGFSIPESDEPGKFSAVCDFEVKEGQGKPTICMVKIGDTPLAGYGKGEEKSETKPSYGNMAQGLMANQPTGAGDY